MKKRDITLLQCNWLLQSRLSIKCEGDRKISERPRRDLLRLFQCWKPLKAVELEGLSRRRLEETLPCKDSVRGLFSSLGISSVSPAI